MSVQKNSGPFKNSWWPGFWWVCGKWNSLTDPTDDSLKQSLTKDDRIVHFCLSWRLPYFPSSLHLIKYIIFKPQRQIPTWWYSHFHTSQWGLQQSSDFLSPRIKKRRTQESSLPFICSSICCPGPGTITLILLVLLIIRVGCRICQWQSQGLVCVWAADNGKAPHW